MFYKKEVNLQFRQSDLLEFPDCFLGGFFSFTGISDGGLGRSLLY